MITRFRRRSDVFAGVGTALIVFAVWAFIERDDLYSWVHPLLILGSVLFIVGCCYLARAKGYHPLLGWLGLLCLGGLMVLFLLPDRQRSDSGNQHPERPTDDDVKTAGQD